MDPVTLHFNVFQAGAEGRKSLQVEDPRGTTIGALKKQLFSDEIKTNKSVRFIASGRVLDDKSALSHCGLGNTAHIHVSISDSGAASRPNPTPSGDAANVRPIGEVKDHSGASGPNNGNPPVVGVTFFLGAVAFIGTGVMLYMALRKRWQFTLHTSQLIFIGAAVWVYLLLCHGLPALFQALGAYLGHSMSSSTSPKDASPCATAGPITPTLTSADEVPETATAAASPGLSMMAPTLPPGNGAEAAASVLTQRR